MIPRILGALLLCLACAAQAGVYTYIDAEGNRVYTDQPPSGRKAQRVELAPGNSVAPPATPTHQIGAITRTTFYTVPISGHRSSPKTFPAHL